MGSTVTCGRFVGAFRNKNAETFYALYEQCQWRAESPQFWRRKIPQSDGVGDQPFGRSRPPFFGGLPRRRSVGGIGAGWMFAFERMCSGRRSACSRSR